MGAADKEDDALLQKIAQRIAQNGPITLEEYMTACLYDEAYGYYKVQEPLGRSGDFITSPEVSQIFGELIGIWIAHTWQQMRPLIGQAIDEQRHAPFPLHLIELGPGRGILMKDALRAMKVMPDILQNMHIHLVETSPSLRQQQEQTLETYKDKIQWHGSIETLPEGPAILIANEFFDALPVRQFILQNGLWFERTIDLVAKNEIRLCFSKRPHPVEDIETFLTGFDLTSVHEGSILEINPPANQIITQIAHHYKHHPFALLAIDYGHSESGCGDTLQAVSKHHYCDPLTNPGAVDLTTHVDFAALKRSAEKSGLATHGPIEQGAFLLKMGLEMRLDKLLKQASPAQHDLLKSGAYRLIDPHQMGSLFKVLAMSHSGLSALYPF